MVDEERRSVDRRTRRDERASTLPSTCSGARGRAHDARITNMSGEPEYLCIGLESYGRASVAGSPKLEPQGI
jgi:hypothetical protein